MGEVYRADDLELGQSVALKFLPERVAADASWLNRFRNEVRTAREIAHPNVCRIYDIAEQDGHVFLSMEYIDGEDLAGVLRRLGRPSREKSIEIARQICLGLAAAHENNVLHRDLKPANIMIDGRGRVRITDFGLAGFLDELEQTESRAGTPAYMAPEQLTDGKVSARSDIYSLGLILYELFTGKGVFATNNIEELKRKHASGTVSTPSSITDEIDPAVDRVIMHCLEHQPAQRPQSVYQVLAALPGGDPLAAALAAGETPSPELVANAKGRGGLRPAVALTLLGLCFAAVIGLAVAGDTMHKLPQKGQHVLSVEAAQAMARLGHTDLPANSVGGFDDPWEDPKGHRYWRRWASGSLLPSRFHNPYWVDQSDPPMSQMGDALIELDATGRLVKVDVIADPNSAPHGETDWAEALELAGYAKSDVQPTEPTKRPLRAVDELRAWRVDAESDVVIQAGAAGGNITYFEIIDPSTRAWRDSEETRISRFAQFRSAIEVAHLLFAMAALVVMIVLAVRNIRLRRSDLQGALRVAVVMASYAFLVELLSIRIHEMPFLGLVWHLLVGQAGGHIALHGVHLFIAYAAIEPYLRRLLPRMMVGTVRLVSGRITDPFVGREILIGSLVGIGLPAAIRSLVWTVGGDLVEGSDRVVVQGVVLQVIGNLVSLGWGMQFTLTFAVLTVLGRIVLRSNAAALLIASVFVTLQYFQFFSSLSFVGTGGLVIAIVITVAVGTAFGAVGAWSGLLSVAFAFAMFFSVLNLTFSLKLGEWYSVNTVMSAAFVLTFPIVGCWLSLAGQPIFKDVLSEAKAPV